MTRGLTAVVVDPNAARRAQLTVVLRVAGFVVESAGTAVAGFNLATRNAPDLLITALLMPGVDGLELLAMLTRAGYSGVTVAVDDEAARLPAALKAGVVQAWRWPLPADEVAGQLAAMEPLMQYANLHLHGSEPKELFCRLAGKSPVVRKICSQLPVMAAGREPIFIHGEPGSGKHLLARLLHDSGPRRAKPFVVVPCAGLGSTRLVEALFTGGESGGLALPARPELAEDGTVVLDEVAALPPALQAKLIEYLPDPVRGHAVKPLAARLIAMTARSLLSEVSYGSFNRDLYHRLDIVSLHLPPLRRRADEIPELVPALLRALPGEEVPPRLGADALARLGQYYWPGNLQQLLVTLARLRERHPGATLDRAKLPLFLQPMPAEASTAEQEQREAQAMLADLNGDRRRTAALLGCTPAALARRLGESAE